MTALPKVTRPVSGSLPAQVWFQQHLPEIASRCHAVFCRLPDVEREEAAADALAAIYEVIVRAQQRGRLGNLTPFWLVSFAARHYRSGRRFTGSSSTDVMSERARVLGRVRVVSLDRDERPAHRHSHRPEPDEHAIEAAVAGMNREDEPFENVRRRHDYPWILREEKLGRKARQIFKAYGEDWTTGVGKRLASQLQISTGRVCQLKDRVGAALQRHGYGPPLTHRTSRSPR